VLLWCSVAFRCHLKEHVTCWLITYGFA
jgi:hypothetical protein